MSKFTVYHKTDTDFSEEIKSAKLGAFDKVAEVECDDLGEVFHLTNHIDSEWWSNENVKVIKKSRSTSVGDIVINEKGEINLCCSVGWKIITITEKLRLAGKRQRRYYLEKAEKWWTKETAMFFGDVKSIAIRAVAEYIANQKGFTLYNKK